MATTKKKKASKSGPSKKKVYKASTAGPLPPESIGERSRRYGPSTQRFIGAGRGEAVQEFARQNNIPLNNQTATVIAEMLDRKRKKGQ